MATLAYQELSADDIQPDVARIVTWTLSTGDMGEPFDLAGYSDRSIQVLGSLAGSTVTFQGSLDRAPNDSDYSTMHDVFGTELALTTGGLHAVSEAVRWARPVITGGTATGITIHLIATGR